MAVQIILDGYNVIYRMPEWAAAARANLESARHELIRFMAAWRQNHGGEVTLVFDRRKQALAGIPVRSSQTVNGIRCIFTSPGAEADDEIIRIARREKNPENVTVVSEDGQILNHCKALGIRAVPVSFLVQKKASAGAGRTKPESKTLSPRREQDITRWYEEQMKRKKDGGED